MPVEQAFAQLFTTALKTAIAPSPQSGRLAAKINVAAALTRDQPIPQSYVERVLQFGDAKAQKVLLDFAGRRPDLVPILGESFLPAPVPPAPVPLPPVTGGPTMLGPSFVASSGGFGGGGFGGIGDLITSAIPAIGNIFLQRELIKQQRKLLQSGFAAAPSGFPAIPAVGAAGLGALGFGFPGFDLPLPGGLEEAGTGLFGPDLFVPATARDRPRSEFSVMHDGKCHTWRYAGRPILYSSDRSIARRFAKLTGGRRVMRARRKSRKCA